MLKEEPLIVVVEEIPRFTIIITEMEGVDSMRKHFLRTNFEGSFSIVYFHNVTLIDTKPQLTSLKISSLFKFV
jgi:hypothetical protein